MTKQEFFDRLIKGQNVKFAGTVRNNTPSSNTFQLDKWQVDGVNYMVTILGKHIINHNYEGTERVEQLTEVKQ